jgi:hypothetical protein
VNLIDIPTVQKYVHDLFYPSKVTASPSPAATKGATKKTVSSAPAAITNNGANGNSVDGSNIPCVN